MPTREQTIRQLAIRGKIAIVRSLTPLTTVKEHCFDRVRHGRYRMEAAGYAELAALMLTSFPAITSHRLHEQK